MYNGLPDLSLRMIQSMHRGIVALILLFLAGVHFAQAARAQMTIEIVGGAASRIPVAIAPFTATPAARTPDPAAIVRDNLARSGLFRLVEPGNDGQVGDEQTISHGLWRGKGADALVVGQTAVLADGRLDIRFRLYDVVRERQLAGMRYTVSPHLVRAVAHKISDIVYEKLTGEPGAFGGRIAYVLRERMGDGLRYALQVSDVDGHNAFTVMSSREPIISPTWSPDGARLAYVSFEQKKPVVYIQSLADGRRQTLASFHGSNSAPAWSPDGNRLAIVLSKDDTSQIYLINADGTGLTRLSQSGALETEPTFSPDGQWLYFTSDRGGSPQIYRMPVAGGEARRLTFNGAYNVSPAVSPDGKWLAYVHRREGNYHIAVMELATGQTQILTDTRQDESPSFAHNSRTILYATLVNGRGVLATVSVDGRLKQRLSQSGDMREPAWAP